MKKVLLTLLVVTLVATAGAVTYAANDTKTVTVTATVSATAKLDLGGVATLTFPNADPDTTADIPANEGAISITAKGKTSAAGTITLDVVADADLTDGGATIAITNLKWTAGGAGYVAGTMSKAAAQAVGSWGGSGSYAGTQTYTLTNSWSYVTGNYGGVTLTYTLTAP